MLTSSRFRLSPSKAEVVVSSGFDSEEDTRLARSARGFSAAASLRSVSFEVLEASDSEGPDLGECNGPKYKASQKQRNTKHLVNEILISYFRTDFVSFPVVAHCV